MTVSAPDFAADSAAPSDPSRTPSQAPLCQCWPAAAATGTANWTMNWWTLEHSGALWRRTCQPSKSMPNEVVLHLTRQVLAMLRRGAAVRA